MQATSPFLGSSWTNAVGLKDKNLPPLTYSNGQWTLYMPFEVTGTHRDDIGHGAVTNDGDLIEG